MTAPEKKVLLIVLDGMGDRACPELRGMTPLQYIRTPNLDWFVEHGCSGLCDPVAPGVRAGSDVAHLSLLGYNPRDVYKGRGAFEAIGAGFDMQPGDVAFRCNFATLGENNTILDRRAGRIGAPETTELAESIDGMDIQGIECFVRASTEHRAFLLLRGDGLSADVTDCDPGKGRTLLYSTAKSEDAEFTADVVNEFIVQSNEILRTHMINRKRMAAGMLPANIILPRGASEYISVEPFSERYGMRGTCVAGVGLIKGICKVCGMDIYALPAVCDGTVRTDLFIKMQNALDALTEYDFVLLNIKAGDVAGHDGNAKLKADIVKRVDEALSIVKAGLPEDCVVVITCDHCTPCTLMDHSGDPVPITFYTNGMIKDDATEFSESGCAKGSIGRIRGTDVIPICLDLANRSEKYGS